MLIIRYKNSNRSAGGAFISEIIYQPSGGTLCSRQLTSDLYSLTTPAIHTNFSFSKPLDPYAKASGYVGTNKYETSWCR